MNKTEFQIKNSDLNEIKSLIVLAKNVAKKDRNGKINERNKKKSHQKKKTRQRPQCEKFLDINGKIHEKNKKKESPKEKDKTA